MLTVTQPIAAMLISMREPKGDKSPCNAPVLAAARLIENGMRKHPEALAAYVEALESVDGLVKQGEEMPQYHVAYEIMKMANDIVERKIGTSEQLAAAAAAIEKISPQGVDDELAKHFRSIESSLRQLGR